MISKILKTFIVLIPLILIVALIWLGTYLPNKW